MTFNQLKYHLEGNGCNVDPYIDDSYWATNVISFHECVIERLGRYSVPTLCHYFYELNVPAPPHLRKEFEMFREFRKYIESHAEVQNQEKKD